MRSSIETLVKALRILARDIQSGDGVANAAIAEAADRLAELERENAARRNEIARLNGQTMWICSCGGTDCAGQKENAALRKALADVEELERYSGSNGGRQWGRCSAWLHPDDAVVIISAKALDAVRKEAQP